MKLLAWVDGGARGNPGPAGFGVRLCTADGRELRRAWGFLGDTTNNVAEYQALIAALRVAIELGASELDVRTDSELLQRQVAGVYRVKQPHLQLLMREVRTLMSRLPQVRVHHVRREENRDADALANLAMDTRGSGQQTPSAS